jgi:virginiamycin B lyase
MARLLFIVPVFVVLAACGKGTPVTSGTPTPPPTPPPSFTAQYPIPTKSSSPGGIALGSDGNLWFTEFAKSKIGQLDRAGQISETVTPSVKAGPLGIATGSGPNLNLWFTEYNVAKIGQITTSGPPFVEYDIPNTASRPFAITLGSDGHMWFTDRGTDSIWQIKSIKRKPFVIFTQFKLTGHAQPGAITTGGDGALWFTEAGTDSIGRLPVSGSPLTEYRIPTPDAQPAGITASTDNAMWFTERHAKKLGRMSLNGNVTAEYLMNNADTPDQIVQGVDGNFYFTDTLGNKVGQFFFHSHHVSFYRVPTAASGPSAMVIGLDSQIYLVESTGNKLAQFSYFNV